MLAAFQLPSITQTSISKDLNLGLGLRLRPLLIMLFMAVPPSVYTNKMAFLHKTTTIMRI
jgi:hypothetical protein